MKDLGDRRAFVRGAAVFGVLAALPRVWAGQTPAQEEPRFVEPPGEPTAEVAKRIAALREALAGGKVELAVVLADPANTDLRAYKAFREVVRDQAKAVRTPMVPRGEAGEKLRVAGSTVDAQGKPLAGVLVYAYQTSAKGWYSDRAPHISGDSGDVKHARLFAYTLSDANGAFALDTVRPGGYPRSTLPCHIHIHFEHAALQTRVTEILFDDDPRLIESERAQLRSQGFVIVVPKLASDGVWDCDPVFRLVPRETR